MVASSPPVVVRVISPGPGLMTLLVTFLVGAATALVVQLVIQLYVVPRVETRKRREDRWERDVRELGELLTTSVGSRAQEAYVEQSILRTLKRGDPEFDSAKVAKGMTGRTRSTLEAMTAFSDLAQTRVDWLADRVIAFMPTAVEIMHFQLCVMTYDLGTRGLSGLHRDDDLTDIAFEEAWAKEHTAREGLIGQIRLLANLPHPPRAPWHPRLSGRRRSRARTTATPPPPAGKDPS